MNGALVTSHSGSTAVACDVWETPARHEEIWYDASRESHTSAVDTLPRLRSANRLWSDRLLPSRRSHRVRSDSAITRHHRARHSEDPAALCCSAETPCGPWHLSLPGRQRHRVSLDLCWRHVRAAADGSGSSRLQIPLHTAAVLSDAVPSD